MSDDWKTRAKPASYPARLVWQAADVPPRAELERALAAGRMRLVLPLALKSFANVKEHPFAKTKRVKTQRAAAAGLVRPAMRKAKPLVVVVLRRVAPGELDDDNLRTAFKAIRDGVADGLMLRDDKSPLVRWKYDQRNDGPGAYGVEIEVLPA